MGKKKRQLKTVQTAVNAVNATTASNRYLTNNRNLVAGYNSLDDYIHAIIDGVPPHLRGFDHHIISLRNRISRTLYSRGFQLGNSVLEVLIFDAIMDNSVTDIVESVVGSILKWGLCKPGFLVHPLHSLGILDFGFYRFFKRGEVFMVIPDAGLALTPQTNSLDKTIEFLKEAKKSFSISKRLPVGDIQHYMRSRNLTWLHRNPLLVIKMRSFTGEVYENQFLFLIKLRFACAYFFMLESLQKRNQDRRRNAMSTSITNNFQTLDIRHFLLFEAPAGQRRVLTSRCIPINVARNELADLSNLNVEIDPREWNRRKPLVSKIQNSLAIAEAGFLEHCLFNHQNTTAHARTFRKLYTALNYFRKSFRQDKTTGQDIIALATAFEVLLNDFYSPGIAARLKRRTKRILKGIPGVRMYADAIVDLYNERCSLVHGGSFSDETQMALCREAFSHSFLRMAEQTSKLPENCAEPIDFLIEASADSN